MEFFFPGNDRVEYRSASRIGESDGKVNRKRIKALRQVFLTAFLIIPADLLICERLGLRSSVAVDAGSRKEGLGVSWILESCRCSQELPDSCANLIFHHECFMR